MSTAPFVRPVLKPAAPIWIVRDIFGPHRAPDAVEIVFVGHANRDELDAMIERIARWPWSVDEDGGHVEVLADSHADPIGVRIVNPSDVGGAGRVREILINFFTADLVAQAFDVKSARKL